MEGVKGNAATLMKLAQNNSILCLQETWLWTFEESTLENIIPNYEGFVRCSDMNENISNFQITRGKGGIAILWPRDWSNSVKRLEEGNERVQAVEFTTTQASICVINVYLPTLKLPISKESYQENLDMVHHILQKYAFTHKVIVCGDFNGSLSDKRTNPHDILLKNFVKDHNLYRHSDHGDSPTFIGHTGSSSQIDYVLVNCQSVISRIIIEEKSPLNMSSHVPVLAQLNFMKKTINCNNVKTKTRTVRKLNLLYIIDSIILILLKAITYNLYIYNQRGVTQLINIYFFLCFYNLLSRTL